MIFLDEDNLEEQIKELCGELKDLRKRKNSAYIWADRKEIDDVKEQLDEEIRLKKAMLRCKKWELYKKSEKYPL